MTRYSLLRLYVKRLHVPLITISSKLAVTALLAFDSPHENDENRR